MAVNSGGLDKWRDYFRTVKNSDIFDIIEHAIMVAASDCPKEFKLRRDRIAETLFSCKLSKCNGCDRVELAVPKGNEDEGGCKSGIDRDGCEFGGSKESKVNSSRVDDHVEVNVNQVSNYSFDEAEALTNEIELESQIFGEVLRIKEIIDNSKDESNAVLFDSLRRLELMALSVETLKATEIGKAVNILRKHSSKEIRQLARTLIEGWKLLVDEWVSATEKIAGATDGTTPESANPSIVEEEEEEEGLPSPPLDDIGFFAATMDFSEFFDGMDDDGNPRNSLDSNKNCGNGRKPGLENHNVPKQNQRLSNEPITPPTDNKSELTKNQETLMKKNSSVVKPNRPFNPESGPGRPTKPSVEQRVQNETKFQPKPEKITTERRPQASQLDKLRCSDEAAEQVKLEATKRKLQERYQQAENAKRQRTIQVMELHDLPKQGLGPKNPHVKPGIHKRHWANVRH
ncbi:hypothetical protein LguiB_004124 [Lonicera macranthoides]